MRSTSRLPVCVCVRVCEPVCLPAFLPMRSEACLAAERTLVPLDPINEMTTRCHHPRDPAILFVACFPFVRGAEYQTSDLGAQLQTGTRSIRF